MKQRPNYELWGPDLICSMLTQALLPGVQNLPIRDRGESGRGISEKVLFVMLKISPFCERKTKLKKGEKCMSGGIRI